MLKRRNAYRMKQGCTRACAHEPWASNWNRPGNEKVVCWYGVSSVRGVISILVVMYNLATNVMRNVLCHLSADSPAQKKAYHEKVQSNRQQNWSWEDVPMMESSFLSIPVLGLETLLTIGKASIGRKNGFQIFEPVVGKLTFLDWWGLKQKMCKILESEIGKVRWA